MTNNIRYTLFFLDLNITLARTIVNNNNLINRTPYAYSLINCLSYTSFCFRLFFFIFTQDGLKCCMNKASRRRASFYIRKSNANTLVTPTKCSYPFSREATLFNRKPTYMKYLLLFQKPIFLSRGTQSFFDDLPDACVATPRSGNDYENDIRMCWRVK